MVSPSNFLILINFYTYSNLYDFFIVEEGYLYSNGNYKSSGCFGYNVYIKSHIHLIESVMMRKNQIVGKTLWWKIVICANRNQENTNDRKCTCRLYGQMGDNDTWPWSAYIIFFILAIEIDCHMNGCYLFIVDSI